LVNRVYTMGRYYDGDISGKFWFGVQMSNAADRFGSRGYEPNYIEYHFDEDNLEDCEKEIKAIEDKLGDKLNLLEEFFNKPDRYGFTRDEIYGLGATDKDLEEYADLELGRKIRNCIKEKGYCDFTAEL